MADEFVIIAKAIKGELPEYANRSEALEDTTLELYNLIHEDVRALTALLFVGDTIEMYGFRCGKSDRWFLDYMDYLARRFDLALSILEFSITSNALVGVYLQDDREEKVSAVTLRKHAENLLDVTEKMLAHENLSDAIEKMLMLTGKKIERNQI